MEFNDDLNAALKYGTDDLKNLFGQLTNETATMGPNADLTFRGVLADRLQDAGRDVEAALLRDGQPVHLMNSEVEEEGKRLHAAYPHYAHPGSYPIVYHHRNDSVSLCPHCLNEMATERAKVLAKGEQPDESEDKPQDFVGEVHYEGPPHQCVACNAAIESAYGDPDAEGAE